MIQIIRSSFLISYFLFGLWRLTLYSFIQSWIQCLLIFSWSFSGTGSGCCFSHSSYTCWHFDQKTLMGKRPFNTSRKLINHWSIAFLTSGALYFIPPPLSRDIFLEGFASTNSLFKNFSWHLFANFKTLLRLSCLISAKSI